MNKLVLKMLQWAVCHHLVSVQEITESVAILKQEMPPIKPPVRWTKRDGVIRFTKPLVANGWSAEQWKDFFGDNRSDWANQLLDSPDFQPTPAGTVVNLAILLGELFTDDNRTTRNIRAKETQLKFVNPNADCVLLIIKDFSVEEIRKMGLSWIIGMHKPIDDSGVDPGLLGVGVRDVVPWLNAYYDNPDNKWNRKNGFVVAVPQLSSFLLSLLGGVLFCQLSVPTAQHPSDFFNFP